MTYKDDIRDVRATIRRCIRDKGYCTTTMVVRQCGNNSWNIMQDLIKLGEIKETADGEIVLIEKEMI